MVQERCLTFPVFHNDIGPGCLLEELLHSGIEDVALLRLNWFEWPERQILHALDVVLCSLVSRHLVDILIVRLEM